MWNQTKSAKLSLICTRLLIALVIIFAAATPYLVGNYVEYAGKDPEIVRALIMTIYACCIPGLISLVCLDRLLHNIRREDVFIEKNVKLLRVISWCSFAVSIILAVSGAYYILFVIVAIAAAFFGLILRVVKNVIEQAVLIKNENDFTI